MTEGNRANGAYAGGVTPSVSAPASRLDPIVRFLIAATIVCGTSVGVRANLPDTWWAERAFEPYMMAGPRAASFHAQLEIARTPEQANNSSFGHCLVAATLRRVFKGTPSLRLGDLVTLRGLCAGLNEKTAGIQISADASTPAVQDLRKNQLVEAWFHDIIPDQGNAYFTTRLLVIPALSDTSRDPLPPVGH